MGRGCTMDEWVHFDKLPSEGRVPNSSYWYVHCRHCVRGFEQKQLFNPPAKLTGRRSAMRAHLKICPMYSAQYKMEQRALAAAAAAAAATANAAAAAAAVNNNNNSANPGAPEGAGGEPLPKPEGLMVVGDKRKRRGDEVEVSGPRGGRGKHCMMEEWDHFIRLQDEGYIGKSNFFYAVCRHCQQAYDEAPEDKKPLVAPEKMVGRREKMRKHLTLCPYFKGELPSLERRTQVRTGGPGAFLPMPTPDGIKMVPASTLAASISLENVVGLSASAAAVAAATPNGVTPPVTGAETTPSSRLALDEWQYFTRLQRKKDSAYYYARCNFCQQALETAPEALKASITPTIVMGRKSNMQTHLAKCPYVPKDTVLFAKSMISPLGGVILRDDLGLASGKRLKPAAPVDNKTFLAAILEFTLQHRMPFNWVESTSAKKLLGLVQVIDGEGLPSGQDLRGQVLEDLYRNVLDVELPKLKLTIALANGEEPVSAQIPVEMKVMSHNTLGSNVPTLDCSLVTSGANVPLQFIMDQRAGPDDDLVTGIGNVNGISYYHGLEIARWINTQIARVLNDDGIATGVVVVPPSPRFTRAVGILRQRWPNVVFMQNFDDLVTYSLTSALQDTVVVRILSETLPMIDNAVVRQLITVQDPSSSWTSFALYTQELLANGPALSQHFAGAGVNHEDLLRVSTLLRAFSSVMSCIAVETISIADHFSHLAALYEASEGFEEVRRSLEVVWAQCEQPLILLANALNPHTRLRAAASTEVTKLSFLSDASVVYYSHFFSQKPMSLRGDVTSFLHSSAAVFADSFISEFPVIEDYFRYLGDNFPELAAFMQTLHSFSGVGADAKTPKRASEMAAGLYTEDERQKLAVLEDRWHVTPVSVPPAQRADGSSVGTAAEAVKRWFEHIDGALVPRMVDFSELNAQFEMEASAVAPADVTASAVASVEPSAPPVEASDEIIFAPLPTQLEDDPVAFPATELRGVRGRKIRLAELFPTTESTTI